MASLDILIPTFARPAALAVLLTSLAAQDFRDFRLVISDQTEDGEPLAAGEVLAVLRLLRTHGHELLLRKHLPRRGMAEHRESLLSLVEAPRALFLDDDLILEPWVAGLLMRELDEVRAGFAGCGLIGLSYVEDERPQEQHVELWDGPVVPEEVEPGTGAWERYKLHNAANLYHLQGRMGATPARPLRYKIAWVGGCVLYDTEKLRRAGGFGFWTKLPPDHAGEDVLAQLRVMRLFGGFGVLPSGVYHQELPTTIPCRSVDAPKVMALEVENRRLDAGGLIHDHTAGTATPGALAREPGMGD